MADGFVKTHSATIWLDVIFVLFIVTISPSETETETFVKYNTSPRLLILSIEYYTLTNGKFNILAYPITDLWGLSSEKYGKIIFREMQILPKNILKVVFVRN